MLAVAGLCTFDQALAAPENACERHIIAAAQRYDIPVGVLFAVGLAETGRSGSLQPYALNVAGKAVFPSSRRAAIELFRRHYDQGERLIDIGCMQINYRYHEKKFAGLESMLNPGENVAYAARFLAELRRREGSWAMAVARYHAGPDNDAAQKRYICKVISNMVATGFGRWTSQAIQFCQPPVNK